MILKNKSQSQILNVKAGDEIVVDDAEGQMMIAAYGCFEIVPESAPAVAEAAPAVEPAGTSTETVPPVEEEKTTLKKSKKTTVGK